MNCEIYLKGSETTVVQLLTVILPLNTATIYTKPLTFYLVAYHMYLDFL